MSALKHKVKKLEAAAPKPEAPLRVRITRRIPQTGEERERSVDVNGARRRDSGYAQTEPPAFEYKPDDPREAVRAELAERARAAAREEAEREQPRKARPRSEKKPAASDEGRTTWYARIGGRLVTLGKT